MNTYKDTLTLFLPFVLMLGVLLLPFMVIQPVACNTCVKVLPNASQI